LATPLTRKLSSKRCGHWALMHGSAPIAQSPRLKLRSMPVALSLLVGCIMVHPPRHVVVVIGVS